MLTFDLLDLTLLTATISAAFSSYRFSRKLRTLAKENESTQKDLVRSFERIELQEKHLESFREEKQKLLLSQQELSLEKKHSDESLSQKKSLLEETLGQQTELLKDLEESKEEKSTLRQDLAKLRLENVEANSAQHLNAQESKHSQNRNLDLERRVQALKQEKIQLEQELKVVNSKYDRINQELQALKVTLQEAAGSKIFLESQQQAELESLRAEHQEVLRIEAQKLLDLEASHQAERESAIAAEKLTIMDLESQMKDLKSSYKTELAKSERDSQEKLADLKKQQEITLSEIKAKTTVEITELNDELEQTQSDFSTLKVAKSSLEEKFEFKVEMLDQLKEDFQELQAEKNSYVQLIETASDGYSAPEVLQLKKELDQTVYNLSETSFQLESNRESLSSWINKAKQLNEELKRKSGQILDLESQVKQQNRELRRLQYQQTNFRPANKPTQKEEKTPHEILGISPNSTFDEIKTAYKELMKKYNPHIVENMAEEIKEITTEACKEINQAYTALKKEYA